jgi:hypothetical protein
MVDKAIIDGDLAADYTTPATSIQITFANTKPVVPFIAQIYDPTASGTSELLIATANPSGNTYTITALTNSYLTADSVKIVSSALAIGGDNATLDESFNANDAKDDSYHITKKRFPVAPFSGELAWSQRWNGETFPVESTTSTTIVMTDVADDSASSRKDMFLNGDVIIFFPKIWNGKVYDSVYDSTLAASFKEITLTANATWATDQLTLTHASGDNNHALADTDFFVVRKSAHFLYSAGDGESALTEPTVDNFTPISSSSFAAFRDDFTRVNENPITSNGWTEGSGQAEILSNELKMSGGAGAFSSAYRSLEDYSFNNMPVEVYLETHRDATNGWSAVVNYGVTAASTETAAGGIGVRYDGTDFLRYVNTTNVGTFSFTAPATSNDVDLKIQFHRNKILLKVWNLTLSEPEPTEWQEYKHGSDFSITDNLLKIGARLGGASDLYVKDISVSPISESFISRGTVTGLTSVEQITGATRLERSDNKDRPIIFQRDVKTDQSSSKEM